MNTLARKLLRTLGQLTLLALAGLAYLAWSLHFRADVDAYPEYLAEWSSDLVRHFPAEIPAGAAASVSYFPGFLQGGAHMQLRLVTTPETLRRELTRLESRIRHTAEREPGGTGQAGEDPAPLPAFHTSSEGGSQWFPDHFTIHFLVAEPKSRPPFKWNHGRSAGIATAENPPQVVYWAESW